MPSTGTTLALIVAALVLAEIAGLFFRPKGPPTKAFKCARCGVAARHSERTENAWRTGAGRIYCDACHRRWLIANPDRVTTRQGRLRTSGRGCFTVMVALALAPAALWLVAWHA